MAQEGLLVADDVVDEAMIAELEKAGIPLPTVAERRAQQEKRRKRTPKDYLLVAKESLCSRIAMAYLDQVGIAFDLKPCEGGEGYADVMGRAEGRESWRVPGLGVALHIGLRGIKEYLRARLLNLSTAAWLEQKIETWWGEKKEVTCLDAESKVVYKGPIEHAPHPIEYRLKTFPFQEWHQVGSWDISSWLQFAQQGNTRPFIAAATKTVLFPDDLVQLSRGNEVIIDKSERALHQIYDVYFREAGRIFRLSASVFDQGRGL